METYESVPLTNISGSDFTWAWDNKPYTIKAGETKYYPEFLARHLAKHLISRELGQNSGDFEKRERLERQILGVVQPKAPEVEDAEIPNVEEVTQEQVEEVKDLVENVEPFAELKEVAPKAKRPVSKK